MKRPPRRNLWSLFAIIYWAIQLYRAKGSLHVAPDWIVQVLKKPSRKKRKRSKDVRTMIYHARAEWAFRKRVRNRNRKLRGGFCTAP